MVQRTSEAVSFASRDTRQISTPSIAASAVRPDYVQQVGTQDTTSRLVQGILGKVTEGLGKMVDQELENRYLEGAAKAGQIESEDSIEGDFITRDWEVAGYRDTMGRLKMAQKQSELKQNMVNLRAQSPGQFQEYLTAQRNEIMPQLQGMSREQRAASVGKLLLQEQADIALHTAEHKKFIIETDTASYQATHAASIQSLLNAKKSGDGVAYGKAVEAAAGALIGDLWVNSRLPDDVKRSLTTDSLMGAIAAGDANLYQYFAQNEVDVGGRKTRMLGTLSMEDQAKLSKAHVALRKDTAHMRNSVLHDTQASYEAAMANNNFNLSFKEAQQFADTMMLEGAWTTGSQREAFMQKVLDYGYKGQEGSELAKAGLNGDIPYILSRNKSTSDAVEAIGKDQTKRGISPSQRIVEYDRSGENGLRGPAYKAAGAIAGPSIARLSKADGTIDEHNQEVLVTVNGLLSDWEKSGLTDKHTNFLAGMEKQDQERLMSLRAGLRRGLTPQMALTETLRLEKEYSGLSPQQKAVISETTVKEDQALVQQIAPMGLMSTWMSYGKFWSAEADALRKLSPHTSWWSAESDGGRIIGKIAEQGRTALLSELNEVSTVDKSIGTSDRHAMAMSRVVARTIPTSNSALIMPRGMDVTKYFGIPSSTPVEDIGAAIDAHIGLQKGERVVYSAAQGQVAFQKYNDRGEEIGNGGYIKPNAIVPDLKAITDKRIKQYNESHGTGRKVVQDGIEFHYNGDNGAGVDERVMLQFRANLVKNEGVRNTPYEDLSGKVVQGKKVQTVGVGVSSHNPHYPAVQADGTVKAADISNSFLKASNDAAFAASQVQQKLKLSNDSWFLLLSEVAYQSGTNFIANPRYKEVLLNKDPARAVELIQQTPAWQASGAERRKHYESLITKAMRG